MNRTLGITVAALLGAAAARAEFRYTETTKFTGGALAGVSRTLGVFSRSMRSLTEPQTRTTMVQGNKMVSFDNRSMQITDLDAETITEVDLEKKTYSVITFAQMAEAMRKGIQRMEEARGQAAQQTENRPAVEMKVDVKETGQKRIISGLDTREVILTVEMESQDQRSGAKSTLVMTSNQWLAKDVPGYQEVRDFHQRMAVKMAGVIGPDLGAMAMNPQFGKGMAAISKEAAKLDGIALLEVTRMTMKGEGLPAGEGSSGRAQPQQPPAEPPPSVSDSAARGALRRLPGGLGGLGRLGRRKKAEEPPPQPSPQQQPASTESAQAGSLMEMTVEKGDFATGGVDPSKFRAPAGFKQVEHPMLRMANRQGR